MNSLSFLLVTFFLATNSFAKGADSMAHYIVPTGPDLVAHSRFEVEIVQAYTGISSDQISYVFPKELTGDPGLQVDFKRISSDLETGVSLWEAKEMTATCTDNGELVQCNIYLKKFLEAQQRTVGSFLQMPTLDGGLRVTKPVFDFSKAEEFLMNSGLPQKTLDAKLSVLDKFKSSEPAGILSYEYK